MTQIADPMIRGILGTAVLAVVLQACTGRAAEVTSQPVDPADRLTAILATDITHRQDSLYNAFVAEHASQLPVLLPDLALDSAAPPLARANAVLRMGQQGMPRFDVYSRTMADADPRVRGATLGVVGPLATRSPSSAVPILARGLTDPVMGIQAKALQELRDRDLELLRWYIDTDPPQELAEIALATVRFAEARGAPLSPGPDGTLRRVAPAGVELVLRPDTLWPQWDALMGTLSAAPEDGMARTLADSVEAVAGIIPAVVDASGRYVALETARRIEVHDLVTGAVRAIGPGLAPRPMPFTPDFLYFQRLPGTRGPLELRYEVVRQAFGEGAGMVFDTVIVAARPGLRGGLSPLRWVRVHDRGTRFVLHTDGLHNHVLPSPSELGAMMEPDSAR